MTYDDGGGDATCEMLRDGQTPVQSGACDSLTQGGLNASTEHTYTVRISNPAGNAASGSYTASTTTITGKVYFRCDEGYDTPSGYCDSVDGVSVYSQPSQSGNSLGTTNTPTSYKAYCWTAGDKSISPRGTESGQSVDYHPGKDASNKWIKIDYASNAYIPFVWFNIDGVDKNSTGDLPQC
jgi:hypothetical protein